MIDYQIVSKELYFKGHNTKIYQISKKSKCLKICEKYI